MSANNLIKWIKTTSTAFATLQAKNANALYFLEDTGEIYKGSVAFTESVKLVDSLPEKGALGKIYVNNTTLEGKVWTGTAWKTVIQSLVKSLDDKSTQQGPVSGEAVKNYVKEKFATAVEGSLINNITFDKATKELRYTKAGSSDQTAVAIDGFFTGASYDGSTGILSFTVEGGEAVSINLPKDNFVNGGSYDKSTKEIVLTLTQGGEVRIPAVDLVDIYTVGDTATVAMSMDAKNKITANVKVSSSAGNVLKANADGLFVQATDISGKLDKVDSNKAGEIIKANADGTVSTSGVKVGGATLNATPNEHTVATESAVSAIRSALEQSIATKVAKANIISTSHIGTVNADEEHIYSSAATKKLVEDAKAAINHSMSELEGRVVAKSDISTSLNEAAPSDSKVISESALMAALSWQVLG